MPVAIVIDAEWELDSCLEWAARFARANHDPLLVCTFNKKQGGPPELNEPAEESEAKTQLGEAAFRAVEECSRITRSDPTDGELTHTTILEISGSDPAAALIQQVSPRSISLLIVPRHTSERGLDPELAWERELFLRAPCETMLLRPRMDKSATAPSVLVPVDGRPPSETALRWGNRLGRHDDTTMLVLYIEPEVDLYAREVGEQIVERIVRRVLGAEAKVETQVTLASVIKETIAGEASQHGLLLLGANRQGVGQRWRKSSISEWLMSQPTGPTVAVVRPAIPLADRMSQLVERTLKARVPQLGREQRVSLVERVQGSSQWDFDFISLICLSTLIAALGLVQSSAAVVIGAMLVAPLMTPLVAAGLSLVQGNRLLIRHASATVLKGFVLAFAIGLSVGWLIPRLAETPEMVSRGSPNVLDFIVALVGGVAGSYAMGRPNLLSALPGVAIAAALIPPIATAGLAASLGNFSLAFGALLLFVTNIVAIVLGAAAALWAIGIRPTHEFGVLESWVVRVAGILVLLAAAIAAYELSPQPSVPRSLNADLSAALPDSDVVIVETYLNSPNRLRIVVEADAPLKPNTAAILRDTAVAQMGPETRVQIETRQVTTLPETF